MLHLEDRSLPSGFSTYLGGSLADSGDGIAVDAAGNTYVVGSTASADFPATIGSLQGYDVFVAKLGPDGSLEWAGLYGGSSNEFPGPGIALDGSGHLYLTGDTGSGDFPTTPGAFQETHNGPFSNAFVMKLDTATGAIVYSTYLGGSGGATGTAVAVDAAGNAYVTGGADSGFPTTPGAAQPNEGGGSDTDGWVAKLTADGSALVYSTYLGGSDYEVYGGRGIAVDGSGNAYVTGLTGSTDFPTTAGALQTVYGGGLDGFVTKLNDTGTAWVYSTYLGGADEDWGHAIAVDAAGYAYVTGRTWSADFPTTAGAFNTTAHGSGDAYMIKLNPDGSAPVYSTYLGGSGFDEGTGVVLDGSGNAYVTGSTQSADFPTTADAFDPTADGISDAFVTELDAAGGGLVYSTYLGGGGDYEFGGGIALDSSGNVYATGYTQAANFPTTAGAFDTTANGGGDAFVTRLNIGPDAVPVTIDQAIGQADPTAGPSISFNVVFAAPVTGFDASDIDFTGSTVNGTLVAVVTGTAADYTVAVTGMTETGTVVASIPAESAVGPAGTNTLASTSTDNAVTFDGVAPAVTVEQAVGQADPTTAGPITFAVHFSEEVTGFDGLDVSFAGSTVGGTLVADVTGSGADYTVTVTGMTGEGSVVASVPAGATADAAGNGNSGSTSTDNTVFFDNVPPSVTIDQSIGQSDPTNVASIKFDVKFSEIVTGFDASAVSLVGSTAGGTLLVSVSGSGDTYTVTVTGMTTRGFVVASLPVGAATDAVGNLSFVSSSTDNSIEFLNTGTVGFTQAVFPTTEVAAPNTVTITVTRAGQTDGRVSFTLRANDVLTGAHSGGPTATGQADYTPTAPHTFTWADGIGGDQTWDITILPDVLNEGKELISLSLTDPVGSPGLGLVDATVAIAPSNGQGPGTYLDQDGDKVTIRLNGRTGSLLWFRTDPDGDGKGPIELIELTGTLPDPLKPKASLVVAVAKAKTSGDGGTVALGAITGPGLRGISARKTALNLEGIILTGYLGALVIGNITNGADVTSGANPLNPLLKTRINALAIGDGTAMAVGAPVSSLSAVSFGAGSVTAPSIGTLLIKGNMAADVTVTGAAVPPTQRALGTLRVKGAVTGSDIMVAGNVGNVVVGAFRYSRLFAGYAGPDAPNPAGFNLSATVTTFRATGKLDGFQDSRVVATAFNAVTIASVDSTNPASLFGFYADTSLGAITVTGPTKWKYNAALPTSQRLGDFEVKIV